VPLSAPFAVDVDVDVAVAETNTRPSSRRSKPFPVRYSLFLITLLPVRARRARLAMAAR